MAENATYRVTLADGTSFTAVPDGAGNMISAETLDKAIFSDDNLSFVTISENGMENVYEDQVLRTFYYQNNGETFIRIADKTEMEKIKQDMEDAFNGLLEFVLGGE